MSSVAESDICTVGSMSMPKTRVKKRRRSETRKFRRLESLFRLIWQTSSYLILDQSAKEQRIRRFRTLFNIWHPAVKRTCKGFGRMLRNRAYLTKALHCNTNIV